MEEFKVGDIVIIDPDIDSDNFDTSEAVECQDEEKELIIVEIRNTPYPYVVSLVGGEELEEHFDDSDLTFIRHQTWKERFDK